MKRILLLGAGGHAKVLIDALLSMETYEIAGILDVDSARVGQKLLGISVLGAEVFLNGRKKDEFLLVNAVGSTSVTAHRAAVFKRFIQEGFEFTKVCHQSAVVSSFATFGGGIQVMAGVVVQPGALIGENVLLNTRSSIDHDVIIGDHVHVAPGATISGNVIIGENTHVGCGATIIQNIRVGANSMIAAGSVVVKDIPPNSRVFGIPAKRMAQ